MQDVLIIGAGAAGMAASRVLTQAGLEVLVLEARDRVGGRIWTAHDLVPHPVELGAEFIHGEHASTWDVIRKSRLGTTQVFDDPAAHYLYFCGQLRPLPEAETDAGGIVVRYFSVTGLHAPRAVQAWMDSGRGDIDLRTVLEREGVDFRSELGKLVEGSYQGLNAAEPKELGAFGLAESTYAGDGDLDFRIDDGYDAFLAHFAENAPVRLETVVNRITWGRMGVEAISETGEAFRARHAIVTLPLALLQAGRPRFDPLLPPEKVDALQRLGSGPITKMVLRFRERFWPESMERVSTPLTSRFGWRTAWKRVHEEPLLTIYAGAGPARRWGGLGADGALAQALADLTQVFGRDATPLLRDYRFVDWESDPYAGMGYSFVRPGGTGARQTLGKPISEVLFWAGEATNPIRPATVHGAMESGERAARELLAATS